MLDLKATVVAAEMPPNPGALGDGRPCCNDRGELVGVSHSGLALGLDAFCYFIACTEAEEFINKAFAALPELQGKKWLRSQRSPLR